MNFTRNEITLYMFFILTAIKFTAAWPICQTDVKSETRFPRQVIQPSWLNFAQDPIADPTVHVNQQTLSEAEQIRKTIQKAVQEGTYVVSNDQESNKLIEAYIKKPESLGINIIPSPEGKPKWYARLQRLWDKWIQSLFKAIYA